MTSDPLSAVQIWTTSIFLTGEDHAFVGEEADALECGLGGVADLAGLVEVDGGAGGCAAEEGGGAAGLDGGGAGKPGGAAECGDHEVEELASALLLGLIVGERRGGVLEVAGLSVEGGWQEREQVRRG